MTSMMVVVGLVWGIAAPGSKDAPKKDAPSAIVGEWICESITFGGQVIKSPDLAYEFTADGKMIKRSKGREAVEQNYAVNEKKEPMEIGWTLRKNEGTISGIWKVDG